jgi:hypothetical protein
MSFKVIVLLLGVGLSFIYGFEDAPALPVMIADLIKTPIIYDRKLITTSGFIISGLEEFGISDDGKGVDIWIDWANDSRVQPRPPFSLRSDNEFKRLSDYLGKHHCRQVTARITGRFDYIKPERKFENGRLVRITGFGHLNLYGKRLVAMSVSDVVCKQN